MKSFTGTCVTVLHRVFAFWEINGVVHYSVVFFLREEKWKRIWNSPEDICNHYIWIVHCREGLPIQYSNSEGWEGENAQLEISNDPALSPGHAWQKKTRDSSSCLPAFTYMPCHVHVCTHIHKTHTKHTLNEYNFKINLFPFETIYLVYFNACHSLCGRHDH